MKTFRDGPSPVVKAFGSVRVDVLDADRDAVDALLVGDPLAAAALSCGSRSGCVSGDEVRADERKQRCRRDEDRRGRDPPVAAATIFASPITTSTAHAEEEELDPEQRASRRRSPSP